jgi:signal transduction histidine kinase
MGVLTESQQAAVEARQKSRVTLKGVLSSEWLLNALSVASLIGAAVILVIYTYSAIMWQTSPFIGVATNELLEVQNIRPFSNEAWPALEVDVEPGDKLIGMNDIEWSAEDPHLKLREALKPFSAGDEVELVVRATENRDGLFCRGAENPVCTTWIELAHMPAVDFIVHFAFGLVTGIFLLVIGGLVVWQRSDLRAAHVLAISTALLSIVVAGRFDLMTRFDLVPVWHTSAYLFAGLLLTIALSFPYDMPMLRRMPVLRYAPPFIALILPVLTQLLYDNQNPDLALLLPLVAILLAASTLVGVMLWRRQYSTSPIIREQVTLVAGGTAAAFLPLLIWVGYALVSGGNILNIWTPVAQISIVLFVLSMGYAVSQYRLLETDRIIPEFLVYFVLTAMLLGGYSLISIGLSWATADAISGDNPLLISITMGAIVLLFNPVYRYLKQNVDQVMFRQRHQYQDRLESVTRKFSDAVNLNDIYKAIREELLETVSPVHVFMFAYDDRSKGFSALPAPGKVRPETDLIFAADGGLVKYLTEEQSVLYLEPGQPLPMTAARDRSLLAVLGTPLLMRLQGRNRLQGILAVGSRRNNEAYTYEDLRFIEHLVEQASFAIERAQFVDDLEHRVRIQDVLSQVSRALNFAIDFDTLLELIFAQTNRIIDADQFHIVLYDQTIDQLRYSFYTDGDERLYGMEKKRWKVGNDVISQIVTKQLPLRLDSFSEEQQRRNPDFYSSGTHIYAWMGVPLITDTGGRHSSALGVMAVGSSDPTVRFSDEQLQLFQDITNIAASAIDKTQLFHKTEVRAAQLKALNDISNQLASELEDVDRLLETITANAVSILGCEAGSLLLVDEHSGDLIFRVVTGGAGQELIGTRIPRSQPSLVADAVNRVAPVIVNDPAKDTRWHGEIAEEESKFASRALLTVPLVAQGTAVGALQVINKLDGSFFTEEDSALATTFAGQAAIAIQNARLFETQDKQLLARVQELENLAEIDHSLNQTLILDQLVHIIVDWALRQTGARNGAMFLVDQEAETMNLLTSQGYEPEALLAQEAAGQEFPVETGIMGRVIRSRTPSLVTNIQEDPHYIETLPGCVAQIAVPLVQGSTVIGALLIETEEDGVLDLFDMTFLQRLAERASSAVSNALLYSRLEEQQLARTEFVSFIAHELKTPITSMKGYTSLLMRGVVGPLNEQQAKFLATVNNNAEHMEHLVNDIRDMEIIDAKGRLPLQMSSVSFYTVLQEALHTLQQAFDQKDQTLVVKVAEDIPEVWADTTRVSQILVNFLTNANKYTEEGGQVFVTAEVTENIWNEKGVRHVLHISVQDTGLGISAEDLERLFEKYFRSTNQKALDQKGTGLGLTLTRRLIEQHGGNIWVESELGTGTTFHFTLPLTSEIVSEHV